MQRHNVRRRTIPRSRRPLDVRPTAAVGNLMRERHRRSPWSWRHRTRRKKVAAAGRQILSAFQSQSSTHFTARLLTILGGSDSLRNTLFASGMRFRLVAHAFASAAIAGRLYSKAVFAICRETTVEHHLKYLPSLWVTGKIPYTAKQGIFAMGSGKLATRAGKIRSAPAAVISPDWLQLPTWRSHSSDHCNEIGLP